MLSFFDSLSKVGLLNSRGSWLQVNQLLNTCVNEELLDLYINEILRDGLRLGELYKRSYLHPLGFYKCELFRFGCNKENSVRLHIWREGQPIKEDIHDHCFDFSSKVIRGRVEHKIYEACAKGDEFQSFNYAVNDQFESYLHERGTVNLSMTSKMEVIKGETYHLNGDILHKVNKAEPFSVTLLVQGGYRKRYAKVYREYSIEESEGRRMPLKPASLTEFKSILGGLFEV